MTHPQHTPPEPDPAPGLTVGDVAGRTGTTVRTLHHWDNIALASPSHRSPAGYRLYNAADIARVQRIVIYRDLDLSLDEIRTLLECDADATLRTLREQRAAVAQALERQRTTLKGLERMIDAHQNGLPLSAEEQVTIFGPNWNPQWPREARARWGDSAQWTEYAERAAARTTQDWEAISISVRELEADLGTAVRKGLEPRSTEAMQLAERHRASIDTYFTCTYDRHVLLGRMYVADDAFRCHYDDIAPGLSTWLTIAIKENARHHGIDPDQATWGT